MLEHAALTVLQQSTDTALPNEHSWLCGVARAALRAHGGSFRSDRVQRRAAIPQCHVQWKEHLLSLLDAECRRDETTVHEQEGLGGDDCEELDAAREGLSCLQGLDLSLPDMLGAALRRG